MSETPIGSSPGIVRVIITHLLTAITSVAGTIYLNAPQPGSPNQYFLEKLGLVETQPLSPPSLDCPPFKQDTFYGDARQTLKDCGWFSALNVESGAFMPWTNAFVSKALDNEWNELIECSSSICTFEFYKNNGEALTVLTTGMEFTVHSWETYWESDKPDDVSVGIEQIY